LHELHVIVPPPLQLSQVLFPTPPQASHIAT
jgi:hypothetical protein